jgi:hypothetical protein
MLTIGTGLFVLVLVMGPARSQAPVRDCDDHANGYDHESRERKHLSIRTARAL